MFGDPFADGHDQCFVLCPRDDTINLEDIFSDWFAEDFSTIATPLPSQPAVVQQPMPQQVMYNQQPGVSYGQPMQYMMQQPQYVVQDNMQQPVSDAAFISIIFGDDTRV